MRRIQLPFLLIQSRKNLFDMVPSAQWIANCQASIIFWIIAISSLRLVIKFIWIFANHFACVALIQRGARYFACKFSMQRAIVIDQVWHLIRFLCTFQLVCGRHLIMPLKQSKSYYLKLNDRWVDNEWLKAIALIVKLPFKWQKTTDTHRKFNWSILRAHNSHRVMLIRRNGSDHLLFLAISFLN